MSEPKYNVKQITYRTFIVEKETGEEYIVSMENKGNQFKFKCTCPYNSIYCKDCKHILLVKEYLAIEYKKGIL